MTIDRIVDKVRKLKAHAESAEAIGNEAEAQAFAEVYQRLMLQHNLSLTDVEVDNLDVEDPVDRHEVDFAKYDLKTSTAQPWLSRLAGLVMKAYNCRHVRYTGTSRFYIIGRKQDAQVAEWMYATLVKACQRIADNETAKYRWQVYKRDQSTAAARGFKKAFVMGFLTRLAERFEATVKSEVNTSTALVRINKMERKLEDFMADHHKKAGLRNTRSMMKPSHHRDGYQRGQQAADNVNLGQRPIESSGPRKVLR